MREATCQNTAAEAVPPLSDNIPGAFQPPKPLPKPPSETSLFKVLPFLWSLAAGEPSLRWRLSLALLLLVAGKVSGLAGPLLFKHALDSLTEVKVVTKPALYAAIGALVASAASKAVSSLSNEFRNVVFTPVGQATGRRVEYWFFSHILSMDMAFHLDRKTGALARIIERGKRSITMIFRAVVFTFIPTFVELVLVCGLLARELSPAFAWVVLATFVAYVTWTVALTKASVARRKEVNKLDQQTTGKVVDILLNYETVVQFHNQKLDLQHYDKLLQEYQKSVTHLETISAALNGGQSTIIAIGLAAVMGMAGMRIGKGLMTVGDLVLVNGLVLQLSLPLQFLGFLYRDLRQSLVDIEAMFDMLGTESKLKNGTKDLPLSFEGARVEGKSLEFAYSTSASRKVLRGVSFTAKPGENIAIVGPSGSGKSTIVKLLLRLYDSDKGSIILDGIDITELKQESLRSVVAVVPQDTVLFNDTILYNIGYGRPTASRQEIEHAAKQAKLHEAIMRMPEGYGTVVGERGLKLSGGEKQRVAIARAFLKAPRLLVCDEATSALDSATEEAILQSLRELAAGRTCIFVAHRLSTIKHCDTILVVDAGLVIEEGGHEELLRKGGVYAQMWAMQEVERPLSPPEPKSSVDDNSVEGSSVCGLSLKGEESLSDEGAFEDERSELLELSNMIGIHLQEDSLETKKSGMEKLETKGHKTENIETGESMDAMVGNGTILAENDT